MKKMTIMIFLFAFLTSCTESPPKTPHIVIILQAETDTPIKIAAKDLQTDIDKAVTATVSLVNSNETLPQADYYFLVGKLAKLAESDLLNESIQTEIIEQNPGARGGLIHQSQLNNKPLILLTGEDIQGTQYAIYDYSKNILGIDPLSYWTGSTPQPKLAQDISAFNNTTIAPPVVPLLVYFENDVDELLNLKSPALEYDWDSFTNMIDSLVRLKYNGIEMFDMLGRIEFYTRQAYLEKNPGYTLDVPYLEKMMQYVHDKGMYIQVDMMQGRQLHTLSVEASTCWTEHKQEWIDGWRYYLTETPVKNIDIFALRPRNQLLDWKYKSTCGESKVDVFNEVYVEFNKIVNEFKPEAPRVCVCYSDGMQMFNDGFNPPKDFIIAWSDDGFGEFKYLPEDTRGYKFGTYMHAGYWKNHDVHDPYPELVDSIMTTMFDEYDATHYMEVNGQTFRPFLLNIEAYAQAAVLGSAFNGDDFYQEWSSRYFGTEATPDIVNAFKRLHEASNKRIGYVEILWQVKNMQAYLANEPVRQPGKEEFTVTLEQITKFFTDTQPRIDNLLAALQHVESAKKSIAENNMFFHDYVELPMHIYLDLLQYNQTLIDLIALNNQRDQLEQSVFKNQLEPLLAQGKQQLDTIYERRLSGDKNPKWSTWYDPKKRRPNNGFPAKNDLEKIIKHLSL